MKKLSLIYISVLVIALISSCTEEYYLYNDEARLQFGPDISRIYRPSAKMEDTTKNSTFYYYPESRQTDTVYFDLYAIGGVADQDRAFKLIQEPVPGADNAEAGVHYKRFDDPSLSSYYTIKAGEVHCKVPVIMLRDISLKSKTVTLKLQVAQNENFKIGEASNIWRKVYFTDRLIKPDLWDTRLRLGVYSNVKHKFIIDVTGQRWDNEFCEIISANYAELGYWEGVVKIALLEYNANNPSNPLRDENGDLVVIP